MIHFWIFSATQVPRNFGHWFRFCGAIGKPTAGYRPCNYSTVEAAICASARYGASWILNKKSGGRPMILREWQAEIRREVRDEYVEYVSQTGLAGYRASPGNLGAWIAVRNLDERRSEVVTLSLWTSLDEIAAFAGEAINAARYYPEDDKYLLTRPELVVHYDAVGPTAAQ